MEKCPEASMDQVGEPDSDSLGRAPGFFHRLSNPSLHPSSHLHSVVLVAENSKRNVREDARSPFLGTDIRARRFRG